MMSSKLCPRCKEERLIDWFGDRKAPYAICLSCRVELNGERKTKQQEKRVLKFRANCAICSSPLLPNSSEICRRCEQGIAAFDSSPKMLGRAASFVAGTLRKPIRQRKPKRIKARNQRLQKLIQDQRRDREDARLRFEHAISRRD